MVLVVKPAGRGKWRPLTIEIKGDRAAPMLVKVGDKIPVGGLVLRVVKVLP